MRCLAIDDEPLALNIIRDFCSKIDFIQRFESCSNPFDALRILNSTEIDLIFLDIQMPNITGLEFARSIDKLPEIIFTTAYSEHALAGFDLSAVDYLVKPFSFERFLKAVNKAYEIYALRKQKQQAETTFGEIVRKEEMKYLMIRVEYSTVKLDLNSILFIEGLKDYVKIHTRGKMILTKTTMKNIEEKLPADQFVRVHKSFIVAFEKIESIENNRIRIGEIRIPVGDQYKASFYKMLDSRRL
jgi:DNA-binding LytR/AlgR family response regulator